MTNEFNFKVSESAGQFLDLMSPLLYQNEAEYSLLLGLCELRKKLNLNPETFKFITVLQSDRPIGALIISDQALVVTSLNAQALLTTAEYLKQNQYSFPGIVGPSDVAENLAKTWAQMTAQESLLGMGQKIYRLDQVLQPRMVKGQLTVANQAHKETIAQWLFEFYIESIPHQQTTLEKMRALADTKILKNEAYIWMNESAEPVSMNLVGRPTQNGISISGVYTPKHLRRRGYASAVVATTSQKMLDTGKKFCVLYTDIENPTSNKIYQEIGYREVATSKHFVFKGG